MDELAPGIFHWTTFHEGIKQPVHSYFVAPARALIDPRLPEEGLSVFEGAEPPDRILLTNRHHFRHSHEFQDAFGCSVHCHEAGLHEFDEADAVQGFSFGDEVAPGIVALEVGALTPEETALHVRYGPGFMSFADGLIRMPWGALSFVPDWLLGDDPASTKRGLTHAFARLLAEDFDGLLLAHGDPQVEGGKATLRDFVDQQRA
jgi:hypothetical protein